MNRITLAIAISLALTMGCATRTAISAPGQPTATLEEPVFRILVFSKTAGFRHDSIPDGIAAIQKLGAENEFAVDVTEDSAEFTDENLRNYAAVVFLNTTGDVLDGRQEAAFEKYIRAGGGWLGIHSASDTEYDWPFYKELVGAYFSTHPRVQQAEVIVEDDSFAATRHLPNPWVRTDEWYDFRSPPPNQHSVVLNVKKSSYEGSTMEGDHAICWWRRIDDGRALYTALGHTRESYQEAEFLRHLKDSIMWAAGRAGDRYIPKGH